MTTSAENEPAVKKEEEIFRMHGSTINEDGETKNIILKGPKDPKRFREVFWKHKIELRNQILKCFPSIKKLFLLVPLDEGIK